MDTKLVFDQVELLELAGPFEAFSVTHINKERIGERKSFSSSPAFRVILVAEKLDQVSTKGGLRLSHDVSST